MHETHVHVSPNDTWESMKRALPVVDDVGGTGARLSRLSLDPPLISCFPLHVLIVALFQDRGSRDSSAFTASKKLYHHAGRSGRINVIPKKGQSSYHKQTECG